MSTLPETLAERDRLYKIASDYWEANEKSILREAHLSQGGPHLKEYQRLHAIYEAAVESYFRLWFQHLPD